MKKRHVITAYRINNFFFVLILLVTVQCHSSREDSDMSKPSIKEVIQQHSSEILSIPGVVGIYEGETKAGNPCIKIMTEKESQEIEDKIPKSLNGYPVIIEVTGKIKPMGSEKGDENI